MLHKAWSSPQGDETSRGGSRERFLSRRVFWSRALGRARSAREAVHHCCSHSCLPRIRTSRLRRYFVTVVPEVLNASPTLSRDSPDS